MIEEEPSIQSAHGWLDARALLRSGNGEFTRSAASLFVALTVMNASNYLFHVIVSRFLGPQSYGALTALLALLLILSVPLNVLQTTVAKRAAILREEGRAPDVPSLSDAAMRVLTPVAIASCVGFALAAPLLAAFLHVAASSVALLGIYAIVSLLLAVPLGALQGTLRFRELAVVLLVGVGARLAAGTALAWVGYGVGGSLVATILAPAVSLAAAQRCLRGPRVRTSPRWSVSLLRGDFRLTLLGLGAFWLLAAMDIVLARHFLRTTAAGYYASADILARALLFLPGAVSTAVFPRFVHVARSGAEARRWLRGTLGLVAAMSFIGLPVLVIMRGWAISIAFGSRYSPAGHLVPMLSLAMAFLALANLLVYFQIAAGTRSHVVLFSGAGLELVLVALFHANGMQVAIVVLCVSVLVTAVLGHTAFAVTREDEAQRTLDPTASRGTLAPSEVHVTLVLPCHNPGSGLREVLSEACLELERTESHEIVVVSDGSTDDTVAIAREYQDRGVRVIAHPGRVGKGAALRTGFAAARGRYIAFMDADGDISPSALQPFLTIMDMYQPDVVLGSKRHPLSDVHYPPVRRLLSWSYHKLTRGLFRVNVRDTQTGIKLIRRDVLAAVLPSLTQEGYTLDLEMLVAAGRLGYRRIFEAPIRIEYRFASQMRLSTPARIFTDTARIAYRRYVLDAYPAAMSTEVPQEPGTVVVPLRPMPAPGLRILILNWRDIRNPEAGGAEVFTHEVARRWVAEGNEVTLMTSQFPGGRMEETIEGVRVRRIGRLRNGTYHLLVQRELARLRDVDAIVDEINTIPFLTPIWADALPPVVTLIHQLAADVWDAELPGLTARIGRGIESRLLSLYRDANVVTVSGSTVADLRALGFSRLRVVPEGRDTGRNDLRRDKEADPTFLFVGRLAPNKRPDHAVEAFDTILRSLPRARLWIVGQGSMESALRASAGQRVELLGHVDHDELAARMARAHCLLVPSVREGWGLVITEANALGTPAVGYDAPGIRDAIRHGRTGLLVPAGDPAALGEAAAALVADRADYERVRSEAVLWGRCFSWDDTSELLLALIRERIGGAWEADDMLRIPSSMASSQGALVASVAAVE